MNENQSNQNQMPVQPNQMSTANPSVPQNPQSISPEMNQTSMTSTDSHVVPMQQVTVTASNIEPPTVNIPTNTNNNQSTENKLTTLPPKNSKTSTILLILLFLFFFTFIMGMPYIQKFVNDYKSSKELSEIEKEAIKEEEKQKQEAESKKPQPTPEEEKLEVLECTFNNQTASNYNLVETQKFYYNSNNQTVKSSILSHYTFTTVDETYNALKSQCDNDSLKYVTHEGYRTACSYSDTTVEISNEFDLDTFTPIVDGETNIQANTTYQQDINTIKTNLTSQGYTCK